MLGMIKWRTSRVKFMASLIILLLVAISFLGTVDNIGKNFTEVNFKRALITFASARAINGIISVAQGTEAAIEPGGVGVVLSPGEILDPINDLVEQFSQVMLFSTVVLGMQKLLIEISGWFWYSLLLASTSVLCLATLWLPGRFTPRTARSIQAVMGMLILFRFLVPAAAITNEAVFHVFLASKYEEANANLELVTQELNSEEANADKVAGDQEEEKSLWQSIKDYSESVKDKADVSAKFEELKAIANKTTEKIIDLIVVFMLQTLLLPLIFAWLGYVAAKYIVRYALNSPEEDDSD